MGKSKKKKQQDFQKVKLKVGKKLKKADNVTNASFKSRAIQISQQLKGGDSSQPVTKKKRNISVSTCFVTLNITGYLLFLTCLICLYYLRTLLLTSRNYSPH